MTPFWMWLLGRHYTESHHHLKIPVANVFASLAVVTVPVSLGVLLHHFKPKMAGKVAWGLKPATGIIGATFLGFGTYVYWFALIRSTWQTLVACSCVPFCGYVIGITAGKIFKQSNKKAVTISLETGFQNLALAMFMISTSMQPPESDFAGVIPITYTYLSATFPIVAFLAFSMYKQVKQYMDRMKVVELDNVADTQGEANGAGEFGEVNNESAENNIGNGSNGVYKHSGNIENGSTGDVTSVEGKMESKNNDDNDDDDDIAMKKENTNNNGHNDQFNNADQENSRL